MSEKSRTERFEIRLSKAEKEQLTTYAKSCDLTASQYIRILIWHLKPARLPMKKYAEILDELMKIRKELEVIDAEMQVQKAVPLSLLYDETEKLSKLEDTIYDAVRHPLEAFDPNRVRDLPMEALFGKGWKH